jgi:biopolymer transport protein ExbD
VRRRLVIGGEVTAAVDMAPLVDMVFLLLLFFILTATYLNESGVEIERPRHSSAAAVGGRFLPVTITRDGTVFIGQRELRDLSAAAVAQALAAAPERQVLIRADRQVPSGRLLQVMDCCQQAGAISVQVAAEP